MAAAALMKQCEHADLWDEAARFVKYDSNDINNDQCIQVLGLDAKLWQYQWLATWVTTKYAMCEERYGGINAQAPGLGKVSEPSQL